MLEYIATLNTLVTNTARAMKLTNVNELERKATAIVAEIKDTEREIASLSAQLTDLKSADLFSAPEAVGAVKLITAKVEDMSADDIRSLGDKAKEQGDDIVAVIACVNNEKGSANIAVACGKAAVAAGANAGAIVRAVAQLAGGNGGGKPDFAMAGAKDLSKLDDAVAAANGIVAGMLK